MFSIFFGLIAELDEMIKLVEQLLARAVDLGVGLAHILVQGLMVVDGCLQGGDVAAVTRGILGVFPSGGFVRGFRLGNNRGRRRRHWGRSLATRAPFWNVVNILGRKDIRKTFKEGS